MSKQYQYRKHLKYMKNIIPIALLVILTLVWAGVSIVLLLGKESAEGMMPAVIVSVVVAFEALLIRKFLNRFTVVKVSIDGDAIRYTNYKGETIIKYEDITEIKFSSIKYTGGWVKIISGKDNIRLTVVIENIQELLLELKDELDERGMHYTYNSEKFFKFFKTALFSDQSWERIYRIWWKLLISTIAMTGVSVGIGILLNFGSLKLLLATLIAFIWPDIVYMITEIIFGRRIAKTINKETFCIAKYDLDYESRIYKQAALWGAILYIVLIAAEIILR